MEKIQLISFELCPYVQKSIITLLSKNMAFEIINIDLENKPKWFLEISPLGKVPVLKIADKILFESSVINEYLNEINPPKMLPEDPFEKARARAFIEISTTLFQDQYYLSRTSDENIIKEKLESIFSKLIHLEKEISGEYFLGEKFSLIDSSLAPFFIRFLLFKKIREDARWEKIPKIRAYAYRLLDNEYVLNSLPDDFYTKFLNFHIKKGSSLAKEEILTK